MKWLVGVDEVGRGPLAGPVGVGVVKVPVDFDWALIPGVGDSKKVTEKNRGAIFLRATELKAAGLLDFSVTLLPATLIDTQGISVTIRQAILQSINTLALASEDCLIKLDGSLKAPVDFTQETIIKGDSKEAVIGLASIVAKVIRDLYMEKVHEQYPQYNFAKHKGYGTKEHREVIATIGLSPLHRVSYCQNIKSKVKL